MLDIWWEFFMSALIRTNLKFSLIKGLSTENPSYNLQGTMKYNFGYILAQFSRECDTSDWI